MFAANVSTLASHNTRINNNVNNISVNAAGVAANLTTLGLHNTRINTNAAGVASNLGRINTNSTNIAGNLSLIGTNATNIASNNALILSNITNIDHLRSGIAAAMALPDMYLNSDETYSIAGGVGFYEGKTAVAAGISFRAGEHLSFGASITGNGDEVGGKLQARWGG